MFYVLLFGLFFSLEYFIRKRPFGLIRKGFWIDAVWYTFLQVFLLQYFAFRFVESYFTEYQWHLVSGLPILVQFAIVVLIMEFVSYWLHRMSHSWWWLWRVHEVHHSSEEMSWLSANRMHFTAVILSRFIGGAIIALMGANIATLFLFNIFNALMTYFIHANIDIRIGALKYVFNCPEMHQVHHSHRIGEQRSNFGDKLTVWDWIF